MIRYAVVLWRRPGLDRAEFDRRWRGEHLALARALPGLRDARFLPRSERAAQPDDAPDGIGWLAFDDEDALAAALATPEAARLREHTATFADSGRTVRVVLDAP